MVVTGETTILEVLQREPRTREIFLKHGMGCITCMGAAMETIENGARMHGIDPQILLQDLNAFFQELEKSHHGR